MNLKTAFYHTQNLIWPKEGKYILAQYDKDSIIVYQAYHPAIANFALKHGYFGGEFKLTRMSWIKPNFLWMMYRSGWASKTGQDFVLAVRIKRAFFDYILEQAVPSIFDSDLYLNQQRWKKEMTESSVRLQWDPDHDPKGNPLTRRALQLGLRNEVLREYSKEAIIEIINITDFIKIQKSNIDSKDLITPKEEIYIPENKKIIKRLKLS